MKLKKDISLELKNELNLIRDTYIAVIENRQREMTIDDIKKGIKYYQIVGFADLPELLSDSDEDIEAFVDEIFSKVVKIGVSEEEIIKPRTPEQQALAIDVLDEATIKAILSHRQRNVAQAKNENELNCIYMREMQQMLIEHPPKTVNGKTKYGENHYSLNYLASQVFSRVKKSEFAKLIPIKDPDTKEQIDESSSLKQIVRVSKKAKII